MSSITINGNLELKLVKYYGSSIKYKFRLCNPELLTINSECNADRVGIKIDRCFKINNSMFKVKKLGSRITYNNMCTTTPMQTICLDEMSGYFIFILDLSTTEISNEFCIDNIDICVTPVSFNGSNVQFNLSDSNNNFIEFVELTPQNTPPVANPDSYTVVRGTPFNSKDDTNNPTVLSNDSDAEDDELSAELVSTVTHGTLNFNCDGSFTYTAPSDTTITTESFTYRAHDGCDYSTTITVTLNIT